MDSQGVHRTYEDNRESERIRASRRSSERSSDLSLKGGSEKNREADRVHDKSVASDRARTRTRDPDRVSDREKGSEKGSEKDSEKDSDRYDSEEYDNHSLSDSPSRSLSPCSLPMSTVSRETARTNHVYSRRGLQRKVLHRAGSKQPRPVGGVVGSSQSKDPSSSPKDLDVVTRRVLSARLLKINEQRNELSSLRLRLEQLQRENRALRQLQHRQERALHRFEDTESEVARLVAQHGGEIQALRERLRRTRDRERAADRRQRDADDELRRCRAALAKLRRIADDRQLGERDELARKLAAALERAQEDERRIKDLERNVELNGGSFQRQLAGERRKTHEAQEESRRLQEELERLTLKFKEKERELHTRNIYSNRMAKGTARKEADSVAMRKGPGIESSTMCSSVGVQTEELPVPPDFPTPPPSVADSPERSRDGGYFSLKERREEERTPGVPEEDRRSAERERERERERGERRLGHQARPERPEEEEEERGNRRDLTALRKEERRKGRSPNRFQSQRDTEEAEPERQPANRDPSLEKQQRQQEEEEQRRKEQLLAKMREIDREARRADAAEIEETGSPPPPAFPEPKTQRPSGPSFPDAVENLHKGLPSRDGSGSASLRRSAPRRGLDTQDAVDDLSFGGYAPSFGRPAGRAGVPAQRGVSGGGSGSRVELTGGAEEKPRDGEEAVDPAKEKKSKLLQQLFGPAANGNTNASVNGEASTMEVLDPPGARKAAHPNGAPFPWEAAKKRDSFYSFKEAPPARRGKSLLEVAESRPAVKAIGSFDDDVEEVAL